MAAAPAPAGPEGGHCGAVRRRVVGGVGEHLRRAPAPRLLRTVRRSVGGRRQPRPVTHRRRVRQVPDDPEKKPKKIVDVGCGIGGSSRYLALATKYGAQCTGITLSPIQAETGNALTATQGLSDKVSLQIADALEQPFADGMFDVVWSMGSGEHMPDKTKFLSELARVAAPGGTIIIVTCCHRNLEPSETSPKPEELRLLKRISNARRLVPSFGLCQHCKVTVSRDSATICNLGVE